MPTDTVAIDELKEENIRILEPGQLEYERAIATSNLLYRFSRPDFVVRPRTISDVQTIIKVAKSRNITVTVKGNGHSYAGHSTAFKGISLDLRDMRYVTLDMNSDPRTVTIGAGCQWGHVYETLVNGKQDGFIINGGRCPTVGVSGFILGGGLGPFTRSFGMGSDALTEAILVTADGKFVTVRETDRPDSNEGRLFWALRGAGGGNFGVLVQMTLKVQKLRSEYVVAGRWQWFPEKGFTDNVITTMNDFYTAKWPNEMTIDSTWICDLRQNNSGGVRFTIAYNGRKSAYEGVINERITNKDMKAQFIRRALEEKSTRFLYETLVFQWVEETDRAYPINRTFELFSSFVFRNDSTTIKAVTSKIQSLMKSFRKKFSGEQVNFLVTWIHSGGEATKGEDSAFFWRKAVFHTYVTVEWVDKWMEKDMRDFLAETKKALGPSSLEGKAAFINFPDRDLKKKSYEEAYYGDNRDKLRKIKKKWDKDNFFKFDQGVQLPPRKPTSKKSVIPGNIQEELAGGISLPSSSTHLSGEAELGAKETEDEDGEEEDEDGEEEDEEGGEADEDEGEEEEDDKTDQLAREQWEHVTPQGYSADIYRRMPSHLFSHHDSLAFAPQ